VGNDSSQREALSLAEARVRELEQEVRVDVCERQRVRYFCLFPVPCQNTNKTISHFLFFVAPLISTPKNSQVKELTVENTSLKNQLSERDKELQRLRAISTEDRQV
jgi:hypothetical protein